jgi:alginate O-acetyltransferase complex protein AlgI
VTISSYYSLAYLLVLLPLSVGCYGILPQKARRVALLACNYAFFWAVSGKLLVFLLLSTLSVHHIGLWLSAIQQEADTRRPDTPKEQRKALKAQYLFRQRLVLVFAGGLHIGILLALKYTPFFAANLNSLLRLLGLPMAVAVPSFVLPIGISFYTLQAMGYLFDVYRRILPGDRNLLRLALFMSFFPQIMEGPICRYRQTAPALWEAPRLRFDNLVLGGQRILWGMIKKMVVADRLNLMIQNVFSHYDRYDGFVIALAAVGYTFQLYMDFSGTMDVALGSAQLFGISLPENFQRPFFSRSISEFWKRWHITLGTWFKDYLFYPLSLSKPLKNLTTWGRKRLGNHYGPLLGGSLVLLCVWVCNGLWHGAGWQYLFFGLYHFALIAGGNAVDPLSAKLAAKLSISRNSRPYRCFQILRTFLLVCLGELFFRADGLRTGLAMAKRIFTAFSLESLQSGTLLTYGMDLQDYGVVLFTLLLVFLVGVLQEKGIPLRQSLGKTRLPVRFAAVYALALFLVIFGAYGPGYIPVDPIYAAF